MLATKSKKSSSAMNSGRQESGAGIKSPKTQEGALISELDDMLNPKKP